MSSRALVVTVAVALVLVGIALLAGRTRPAAPPAAAPVEAAPRLTPSLISGVSVVRMDGREERVQRSDTGEWNFVAGRIEWPAALPETALAAIAALGDELEKPSDPTVSDPDAGGVTIKLTSRDGAAWVLRLAAAPLGGRTAAAITSPSGGKRLLMENSVLDPLLHSGPAGWRTMHALPGARDASRITLESAAASISLSKLEGRWAVRRPISARASQGGASALLSALAEMRALRFDDSAKPDLAAMGLTKPRLTIQIETDERSADARGEVKLRVLRRELLIGGPADAKGDTQFAAADADGTLVFVVTAAAVNAVSLAPRNYLNPTAISTPPAEVFIVMLRDVQNAEAPDERGFRREATGWARIMPDGTRTPTDAAPVDELLEFLASRPGEADAFSPDDEIRILRRVELVDAEGDAREVLSIGYTADGQLGVRTGNMLVTYAPENAPAILELPAFNDLPNPAPGVPAPRLPEGAPATK